MYKILLLICFFCFLQLGCKRGNNTGENLDQEVYLYDFSTFDLKPFGLKATIKLPDVTANIGASTKPEVIHEEDGFKWEVNVGPNFQFFIDDYGEEKDKILEKKDQLKQLDIFTINYLVDQPDLIVYQTKLVVSGEKSSPITNEKEHISYHVYAQKTIDNYTYIFRSREDGYPKNIIDIMTKSFNSIEEVK